MARRGHAQTSENAGAHSTEPPVKTHARRHEMQLVAAMAVAVAVDRTVPVIGLVLRL